MWVAGLSDRPCPLGSGGSPRPSSSQCTGQPVRTTSSDPYQSRTKCVVASRGEPPRACPEASSAWSRVGPNVSSSSRSSGSRCAVTRRRSRRPVIEYCPGPSQFPAYCSAVRDTRSTRWRVRVPEGSVEIESSREVVVSVLRALRLLDCFDRGRPGDDTAGVRASRWVLQDHDVPPVDHHGAGRLARSDSQRGVPVDDKAVPVGRHRDREPGPASGGGPGDGEAGGGVRETAYLVVPAGTHAVCLERVDAAKGVPLADLNVGARSPSTWARRRGRCWPTTSRRCCRHCSARASPPGPSTASPRWLTWRPISPRPGGAGTASLMRTPPSRRRHRGADFDGDGHAVAGLSSVACGRDPATAADAPGLPRPGVPGDLDPTGLPAFLRPSQTDGRRRSPSAAANFLTANGATRHVPT